MAIAHPESTAAEGVVREFVMDKDSKYKKIFLKGRGGGGGRRGGGG